MEKIPFWGTILALLLIANGVIGLIRLNGAEQSFLSIVFSVFGIIVLAIIVGFQRWNRPKKKKRSRYEFHPRLQH